MNFIRVFLLSWIVVSLFQPGQAKEVVTKVPVEKRYLAQKPPGDKPEIFAKDFFPNYIHTTPVFSQDFSEMFWINEKKQRLESVIFKNGRWRSNELKLTDRNFSYDSPFITPSNDKLFIMVHKPTVNGKPENIWFSQRDGNHWKEPVALNNKVNQHHMHWQLSVADNGNLYFLSDYTGKSPLVMSEFIDEKYSDPINLGENINDEKQRQMGPYIAPDESYLIFSRAPDLSGSDELYISFNNKGQWSKARKIRLSDGTNIRGICPIVSPDGKYLFYLAWTNRQQRTFWVSTNEIEGL